jgi:threonine aldolase
MFFASDNAAGVHPAILEALTHAAQGPAMPYGNDPVTARFEAKAREVFEAPEARAFVVATGTAANSLTLATLCNPWDTVYTHALSHIENDECGAPEFYTGGAKLTLLSGEGAKVDPEDFRARLRAATPHDLHNVQPGALSLTQATEQGAVYTLDETRALTEIAHAAGLPVHMDGTRFANALVHLGCTPAEASWKAGVDVLCLGATKNGALAAEAVILFDPSLARAFELRRKRGGHLFSKMRFVAAQMEAYLTDGLWLEMAAHANALAGRLAEGIRTAPGCQLLNAPEANILFAEIPLAAHRALWEAGARYYPRETPPEGAQDDAPVPVRLVTSFQTSEAEVDRFIDMLRGRV